MADLRPEDFRISPRFALDSRVLMTKVSTGEVFHGRTMDISEGGLSVFAACELQAGTQLRLEFTVPYSSEPLRVFATVRHRDGYRYGLEFVTLSRAERTRITRLCSALQVAG